MRAIIVVAIVLSVGLSSAPANTDMRDWMMASGEALRAELVRYDLEESSAHLRMPDGESVSFSREDFSVVDQAWLVEWAEFSSELDDALKNLAGSFQHYQAQGQYTTDFYVYLPSIYSETNSLPLFIMFHPGGKGARYVKRFMEAAEALGVIVVSCDSIRNSRDDQVEADMLDRFRELLPSIEETVRHDPSRIFMGGTSGGAYKAYHYSAQIDRPWAGIFANGGWLGGRKFSELPYPAGMRIAMVNGNNDRNANVWVSPDSAILTARGSKVGFFSFEGGHQVPPPWIQIKTIDWLLGKTDEVYQHTVESSGE